MKSFGRLIAISILMVAGLAVGFGGAVALMSSVPAAAACVSSC